MLKYKQIWHGIKPIKWLIKFNLTETHRLDRNIDSLERRKTTFSIFRIHPPMLCFGVYCKLTQIVQFCWLILQTIKLFFISLMHFVTSQICTNGKDKETPSGWKARTLKNEFWKLVQFLDQENMCSNQERMNEEMTSSYNLVWVMYVSNLWITLFQL